MSTQNLNTVDHNQACTTQMPTSVAQTALNPISTIHASKLTCGPLRRCNKCVNLYTSGSPKYLYCNSSCNLHHCFFMGVVRRAYTLSRHACCLLLNPTDLHEDGWLVRVTLSLWALFLFLRVRKKQSVPVQVAFCFAGAVVIIRSMEEQATCIFYNFALRRVSKGHWLLASLGRKPLIAITRKSAQREWC